MSGVTSRLFFALQQSGGNTRHHYKTLRCCVSRPKTKLEDGTSEPRQIFTQRSRKHFGIAN
jgi:hypothetical protein